MIAARTAVNVLERVQEIFQVWKFTKFQESLSLFNLKKVDLEMATFMPTNKLAMVRMTREMKTTTTQTFYATLLIQTKLYSPLAGGRSSVSLDNWTFLQPLSFNGALEAYKEKIFTANKTSMLEKRNTEIILQLEKHSTRVSYCFLKIDNRHNSLSAGVGFSDQKRLRIVWQERENIFSETTPNLTIEPKTNY